MFIGIGESFCPANISIFKNDMISYIICTDVHVDGLSETFLK